MTTDESTIYKATVKATTLAAVCTDALHFVSDDTQRRALNGAQLTVKNGRGQVVGTDSYVLGAWTFDADGELVALIQRDDLKRIGTLAKAAVKARKYGEPAAVTLERDGDTLTVRDDSTTLTLRVMPSDFPNWEQLTARAEGAALSHHVAFTVRTLGAFAALRLGTTAKAPLVLRFEVAALKPSHVVASVKGIDFRGLVMPVKVAEAGSTQATRAPSSDDFAHLEIVKP